MLIVVDWSSLTADMQWHWLRASVVVQGSALRVRKIEDLPFVHPERQRQVHATLQPVTARNAGDRQGRGVVVE
jgi:hypothetical protein